MLLLPEKTWSTISIVVALGAHAFAYRMLKKARHGQCSALHYFKVVSCFSTTNSGHYGSSHLGSGCLLQSIF